MRRHLPPSVASVTVTVTWYADGTVASHGTHYGIPGVEGFRVVPIRYTPWPPRSVAQAFSAVQEAVRHLFLSPGDSAIRMAGRGPGDAEKAPPSG